MAKKAIQKKHRPKSKSRSQKAASTLKPVKSDDILVNEKMLNDAKFELIHQIMSVDKKVDSLRSEMNSRFLELDAKFANIDAKFANIDSKFASIDSKFANIDSKLELMMSEFHRVAILIEEQNQRNKFVLDGYASLFDRQDALEKSLNDRMDRVESLVAKNI